MSTEDFNNGLILGLSLQGTMFVDRNQEAMKGLQSGYVLFSTVYFFPKLQ